MRKSILTVVFIIVVNIAFAQTRVSVDSVSRHMGDTVQVCSKVYGIKAFERITYINLGAAYPNSPLVVVVFGKDYANFKELPSVLYANKQICVTGTLAEYKGKPQIVVTRPDEIIVQ